MGVIGRNVTHDVCSHCGEVAGSGAHGHADAPDWRWLRVEYVPADRLGGAVEALRVIANDTTHDGRWAAGRAESALVAMGVDPRLPGGQ